MVYPKVPEFMDFSHFLGFDHFSGKHKFIDCSHFGGWSVLVVYPKILS